MEPQDANHRIAAFFRHIDLSPPSRIPHLVKPPTLDFSASISKDNEEARLLLVQQRISEPGYKPPESKLRHKFSTSRLREKRSNYDNWIFSKHEVANAFNRLLYRASLATPGVAQALISHASVDSLDELWGHLHDPKLEKRTASRFRRSRSSIYPRAIWLEEVTAQNNVDYIHLMCQTGVQPEVLNEAFSTALTNHSMVAMEVLLSHGAVADSCQAAIRERIRTDDVALVKLLLSVPKAMSVEAWRFCMEPQLEGSSTVLSLCLAHHPEIACLTLLLKALDMQNLHATVMILAYAGSNEDFREACEPVSKLASRVLDHELRLKFFRVLAESGLLADGLVLREELLKNVKERQLSLIKILTDAGVSLNSEPNNALHWAVTHMDLEILGLIKDGVFTEPVSPALKLIRESTSEADMLSLLQILEPRGLTGEPLHSHLVRAVRKQYTRVVEVLVCCGASVEFEQGSAIRTALESANSEMLFLLLQSKCSPTIISAIIPTAIAIQLKSVRLQSMEALLKKGVLAHELGVPLQTLVSEAGDIDSDLVRLLLQYRAPIDGFGEEVNNVVLVAARKGNLEVLKMLCDAKPEVETLSKAVPVAFGSIGTFGYDVALGAIKLLLQQGAYDIPLHQTLQIAAAQDHRLDIVRLLVKHGADANYRSGAAFTVALRAENLTLLEILCSGCPPNRASVAVMLHTATDPRYFNLRALNLLLASTPISAIALNSFWAAGKFRNRPDMIEILPCFFHHGLDVNIQNGSVLCFAVEEENTILLRIALRANPSIATMKLAFQSAASMQTRSISIKAMKLLLKKVKSAEIGQTEALLPQTHLALAGDFAGLELLIQHRAVVDSHDGEALQLAANAGALKVLDLLLMSQTTYQSLSRACLAAAASSLNLSQKELVFGHLLAANNGALARDMSKLLADSITTLPECRELPALLLVRRAEVRISTLKMALEKCPRDLFVALASRTKDANATVEMFTHARAITMDSKRRYWVYQWLLSRDMPDGDVCEALLESLEADDPSSLSCTKLLLQHSADVGYREAKAFLLAFRLESLDAVKLLCQYIVNDTTAGLAFDHARRTVLESPEVRLDIYRRLLRWNVSKASLYAALVENLRSAHPHSLIVQLLVAKGADPNTHKAQCFVLAATAGAEPEFRALSRYAEPEEVLQALLAHFHDEQEIVRWCSICLEQQPGTVKIDQDELLFQCLRKFPNATLLLKLLLDNGVPASAKIDHSLCAGWKSEPCTSLIWALCTTPRIGNNTILLLVARGRRRALPSYSTPVTGVTAALGCLLDKDRTPVLKALLTLDRDNILPSEIPGSSLSCLAAPSNGSEDVIPADRLDLRMASMFLGNLDGFKLMNSGHPPNDGSLHNAALLALPKFVKWLLETHDANFKEEAFDHKIPLAVACFAKPMPWCKIANAESDFGTRQKETMRLLVSKTSDKWRYRGKTVLHLAFENGSETTKAMLAALNVRNDSKRAEKYLYTDKAAKQYSPHEYVRELLVANEVEKGALIECLEDAGLKAPQEVPIVED